MDIQMPVLDGIGACREIEKIQDNFDFKVEIVAITSNQGQKHEQNCIEAGMKGFYNKPVS